MSKSRTQDHGTHGEDARWNQKKPSTSATAAVITPQRRAEDCTALKAGNAPLMVVSLEKLMLGVFSDELLPYTYDVMFGPGGVGSLQVIDTEET